MTDKKDSPAFDKLDEAEAHSSESASVDYWPNEEDFETEKECGEFYNALAILESLGRVDEMVRFLSRGTPLSPGVAKTLAYILSGGELKRPGPYVPRYISSDGGVTLKPIPPNELRGPFVVTVVEKSLPPVRPRDPTKSDRYWNAAEEVRKRIEGGEKRTNALIAVRIERKLNQTLLFKYVRRLENGDDEFE